MIFFQKTILQKFTSTALIVCLLFSVMGAVFLIPKKAAAIPVTNTEALSWTTVFQTVLDNVWNYIKSSYDKLSDLSLKKIAAWTIWKKAQDLITWAAAVLLNVLLHQILAQLTNDITAWIQNGTEPRFLSEGLGDWLGRAANNAGGNFVDQYLGAGWLCEPFDLDIKIALRDVPTFETEAECTLTDIVDNIDDFYDDFTTGGWKGWIELTKPQNTFAGAYLLAKDEKMLVMDKEIKEMEKDLDMGEGFLSPKDCYWYSADGDLVETQTDVWGSPSLPSDCQPDPNNKGFTTAGYTAPCSKICQINTPASVVKDVASKSITTAFDKMNTYIGAALSKTGPYAVYIQAIADALINRILTEGKGLLQADAVPSPEYGDTGESENLPEIVDTEDNYTAEASANELITNLNSLEETLEDYLIPQQEETLVAWNLVYDAYEDAIPFLETTMAECSGVIADNYTWASSTKAEIVNDILPPIEEDIDELETALLNADEAISLISVAMFSVEDLIIGVREWEVLYEESYGLETASTTAAQDNIDIAKEIVIGDVQDILSVLDAVITSIDLNETATEIDDLSDEIYDALTEVLMLYSDLAGEIGDPTYPNSGTIYAELEKANGIIEEAKTRAIACIDERNRRAAAARDN